MDDVLYVMTWGEVTEIENDRRAGNYKCTVEGPDIEGQDLVLKLALDEHRYSVVCITVY